MLFTLVGPNIEDPHFHSLQYKYLRICRMESLDTGERVDRKNYYGPKVISLHTNKEKNENLHMHFFKVPVNRVQ